MAEKLRSEPLESSLNAPAAHTHSVSLEALLMQLDSPRDKRKRDMRPQWVKDLADCVADLFEPLARVARVGFECVPEDGRWNLMFYLAAAEHIGGALDGHVEAVNFRFDIATLLKCFERVESCEWRVFPTPEAIGTAEVTRDDIPRGLSSLCVEGIVMTETGLGEPISIEVHSVPPASSGIGLKLYADGGVSETN